MNSLQMASWIGIAKKLKAVAMQSYLWDGDMAPVIDAYRDGKALVRVVAPEVDRDQALGAAMTLATGVRADELWLILDSHMTNQPVNPATGAGWAPGEMQNACEAGACQIGLVTDALLLLGCFRSGRMEVSALPYHVHKTQKQVVWVDPQTLTTSSAEMDGVVPDSIRSAFAAPYMIDVAIREQVLPASQREVTLPIIERQALDFLSNRGFTVLVRRRAKDGSMPRHSAGSAG